MRKRGKFESGKEREGKRENGIVELGLRHRKRMREMMMRTMMSGICTKMNVPKRFISTILTAKEGKRFNHL